MKYRNLGKTDLVVSEVGFGVWTVSNSDWGISQPMDGTRLLQSAFDLGINFFDTADFYGRGYGEEIISESLGSHRHEIIVATKFVSEIVKPINLLQPSAPLDEITPEEIRFSCEQSLRRLKSDYIDLYQIHLANPELIFRDELFDILKTLIKEGKARFAGVDFAPGLKMEKDFWVPMTSNEVAVIQLGFGMGDFRLEPELFGDNSDHNLGIVTRNPHSLEMIPTLLSEAREANRLAKEGPAFQSVTKRWVSGKTLEKLSFIKDHHSSPLTQLAITFCLNQETVGSVLPDITSYEQLEGYSSAVYSEPPCSECVLELEALIRQCEEEIQ